MAHADYKSNRHKPANLNQLPADIQYLLDDKVGPVISEGLNALYKTKPKHPIDYLAKWLLNHEAAQNNKGTVHETEEKVKAILKKYDDIAEVRKKKEAELEAQRQAVERSEKVFKDKLKAHEYHEEMLKNDLPNFIEKQQNLPAVYIGVLEHPSRPVGEEEEEEFAHLDTSQPKLITYIGASGTQKFVMGRELQPETGITYQVFNPPVVEQAEPVEGEEPVVVEPEPTSIYVPDVTQNPAIVYFRIPKLGAYLACDMTYKSVLSELAFDEGIKERIRVQEERERLKKEKEEKEEDYKRRIEEAQEQGLDTAEIEEEWKTQEWPEVEEKPFEFEEKKYVLCIDTLGEDREVTPEERKYIISLAKEFINNWEESEKKQLSKDVDLWLEYDKNVNKEDFLDTATQKLNDEMTEKYHEDEGDSELHQNYKRAAVTADYYKSKLAEEEVKNMIRSLAKYRVIKFKSLLQNVLYFLGYKKGQVNIPGTNVLEWKEVKKMIVRDTFFSKLDEYEFRGPKDDGYWEKYALVNRMAQKFEKFNAEEIEDYNLGLSILFKYVKSSLEARLLDIQVRRTTKEELKKRREEAIAEDENWVATKEREFEEALAQVQAEVQAKAEAKAAEKEEGEEPEEEEEEEEKFNEEAWKAEWNAKWDEEHPRGTIPEPVVDDVDLDIEKEEEAAP